MKIILLGPSGAGKGSIAEFLVRDFGIPHVSTGELFRQNITNGTPIGLEVKSMLDKGQFVPDDVTMRILTERLDKPDCQKGFVLDGFPRTLNQAELLSQYIDVDHAVELDITDERVTRRLLARGRHDDLAEQIRLRLAQYRKHISDILNYYRARAQLITIDANTDETPAQVYKKIIDTMYGL